MPGISGPGTIAVVIGIASEIAELPNVMDMAGAFFMTGVAIVLTCAVTWIVLRSADYISGRLGPSGTAVLTKLMGFLLICIGVQFIGSGIRTFMQVPKSKYPAKSRLTAGFCIWVQNETTIRSSRS